MADSDLYEGPDDNSITEALQTRRIPHSRAGKKGKGGGGRGKAGKTGAPFNPLRSLGRYKVQLGSGDRGTGNDGRMNEQGLSHSWLEIHELTSNDDGLIGSFEFGDKITGICILAGSRKGLAGIVEELEQESDGDNDEDEDRDEADPEINNQNTDGESVDEADDSDNGRHRLQQSSLEIEDERINRRMRNFEKNSFRNPKFWFRWKGSVRRNGHSTENGSQTSVETNTGYIVFSSNECDKFDGTITSEVLGWDNLKLRGHKIHSRPAASSMNWNDLD